jgi:xanthine dehydrogenase YagS FAD-binding subunit
MKAFTYKSATTEDQAVKALGANALALAGGTSLLNLMKERVLEPEVLVNIKDIRGLGRIEAAADGLKIGANATLASILEHEGVRKSYPALAQAIEDLATPQIRNMGTLGGNLCARTPCWYYMHETFSCAKAGRGNTCPAKEGDNEYHAIFATDGPCVSVHASSAAPALIALGAKVRVVGAAGARELDLEKFFTLPKDGVQKENVLAPNEIVTHVTLGKAAPKSATYTVLHRGSHDWPVGLASVALDMNGASVRSARIVLGAVAPVPWRAAEAEAALSGKAVSEETAGKAADAAVAGAAPLAQNAYKKQTARAAVKRAILMAATGKWR